MTYVYEFGEYYCYCDNFLLNSGDIVNKTNFFNNTYFWVKPERNERKLFYNRVFLQPSHFLKCTKCSRAIGIVVYPYDKQREMLRFNNNLIYSKKWFIVKENKIYKLCEVKK